MSEEKGKAVIGTMVVEITVKTNISIWEALKLRIAGKNAERIIDEVVNKIRNAKRGAPDDIQ